MSRIPTRRRVVLPLSMAVAANSVVLVSSVAQAHPGHSHWGDFHPGHLGNFVAGSIHPLMGIDHLLAMVAVGLLAVTLGGSNLWRIPLAFLGSMLIGGIAAACGMPLAAVESGLALSVLVLGGLIVATRLTPHWLALSLVSLFAFFHGHAHVAEMLPGGSLAPYAAGFLLSTTLLHGAGVLMGRTLATWLTQQSVQFAGAAIVGFGLMLML